jgi:hypothetical protein
MELSKEREEGLVRKYERQNLIGKAPPCWNYPLLTAVSLLLTTYGNNKAWQGDVGHIEYAFADGGLGSGPECKPLSGREGTIGTWGVVLVGRYDIPGNGAQTQILTKHTASGLCFWPQFERNNYPGVTNNQAELYAACMAMALLPPGWGGTLVLDSHITKERIVDPDKPMANVGPLDRRVIKMLVERLDCDVLLVPGHQREEGILVSGNNLADRLATEACVNYRERIERGEWQSVCQHYLYRQGCRDTGRRPGQDQAG